LIQQTHSCFNTIKLGIYRIFRILLLFQQVLASTARFHANAVVEYVDNLKLFDLHFPIPGYKHHLKLKVHQFFVFELYLLKEDRKKLVKEYFSFKELFSNHHFVLASRILHNKNLAILLVLLHALLLIREFCMDL
jgi:hypothetical protein